MNSATPCDLETPLGHIVDDLLILLLDNVNLGATHLEERAAQVRKPVPVDVSFERQSVTW